MEANLLNRLKEAAPPAALFAILVASVTIVELALVAPYPIQSALQNWRLSWARHALGDAVAGQRHALAYVALFALYGLAILQMRNVPATRWTLGAIWLGWLAMALLLFRSLPGDSIDIYDYIFRGRMFSEYNVSPLVTPPRALIEKPFARYVTWMDWVDAYGPIWELVSAGIARFVGLFRVGNELVLEHNVTCADTTAVCTLLLKHITAYRAAAVAFTGLIGILIERAVLPQHKAGALLMWLWNPLVLVSSAIGGHNEVLAWVPIVVALALPSDRHRDARCVMFATATILISAHIKITQLILLLPLGTWLLQPVWRAGWPARVSALAPMLLMMALFLPFSWLLYSPFGGWITLEQNLAERAQLSDNALPSLISQVLQQDFGWREFVAETTVGRVSQIVCIVTLGIWAARRVRQTTVLPQLCLEALCIYLVVGAFWFQFWYLAGVVLLVALAQPSLRATRALLLWGASATMAALFKDFAFNAQPPLENTRWVPWFALALQMLPMLLLVQHPHAIFNKEPYRNAPQTLENP
jgi:hypothetical protein